MIKIIKKGEIPKEPVHRCTCINCRTIFECTENECRERGNVEMYVAVTELIINCPVCHKTVVVTHKSMKKDRLDVRLGCEHYPSG